MTAEAARRRSSGGDGPGNGLGASLRQFFRMVKFEHTIFGLPFVCMGGVLAADGVPSGSQILWMLVAAVGARNFAMTLNRYADRDIDPKNPRTHNRGEFQGLLHSARVWVLMGLFCGLFVFSAWMLNALAFALSFVVVGVTVFYSYSKRFTSFSHVFLGFVLGAAPAGAWVAVRGELGAVPILLFAGVTLWVGGFDVIYACLDLDFDREEGLHSLPRRLGTGGALVVSAVMHMGTVACFIYAGQIAGLGGYYWTGLVAASGLLVWEHWVVRPDDLSRVNLSFFNINAWVSVIVSAGGIADVFLSGG